MNRKRGVDRSHLPRTTYNGVITGIYSDAQSRILVEAAININGKETLVKKQKYQLNFEPSIGQEVVVVFVPNKSGVFINMYLR